MIINNRKVSQTDFLKQLRELKKSHNLIFQSEPAGNQVLVLGNSGVVQAFELPKELSTSFEIELRKTCQGRTKSDGEFSSMSLSEFMSRFDKSPRGKIYLSSADPKAMFYPRIVQEFLTMPLVSKFDRGTEAGIRERRLYTFSMAQYKTFPSLVNGLAAILSKGRSKQRQELIKDRLDEIN